MQTVLVMGASGFLGSNVVRLLHSRGYRPRALVRTTSDLSGLRDLDVDLRHGDLLDPDSLDAAMAGCDTVFHCAVDTRALLCDSKPLFDCNVRGLSNALDSALWANARRFVLASSVATVGRPRSRPATEEDPFDWEDAPAYVTSRVMGERRLLSYCREGGLGGVSMCVGTTFGPGDVQPTPQGALLRRAATGRLRYALRATMPCVDIRDAAEAMVRAAEIGQTGRRYIVVADQVSHERLFALAAGVQGNRPPRTVSVRRAKLAAQIVARAAAIGGYHIDLRPDAIELASTFGPYDNARARVELGWEPRPIEDTVRDAVAWFRRH
ncbi:NAD-dependent epimerase/dehydratase family protein [Streptomyces spinoverrucosus]|uniref:NAD-dependent epimerase/dehydratase family protein n=1 Tax=Streptomyces spinoverrucosus TaxID=284043 RepID=UPI0018C369BC|nr:NAD-dependent epimerase/dehydratase family protein [Streptomyces spinoverrucosus]MBG0855795.1 NAD-dependent epimerase/dehydratase family protein [Streptomyces spinoverrucosus]